MLTYTQHFEEDWDKSHSPCPQEIWAKHRSCRTSIKRMFSTWAFVLTFLSPPTWPDAVLSTWDWQCLFELLLLKDLAICPNVVRKNVRVCFLLKSIKCLCALHLAALVSLFWSRSFRLRHWLSENLTLLQVFEKLKPTHAQEIGFHLSNNFLKIFLLN